MTSVLHPYAALKSSGVHWLCHVPEHWHVRRLRTVAEMRVSNVDKHTKEEEFPVRLCNYVDVYKNDRITQGIAFMSATASRDEIEKFRLNRNDVVITKDSEAWDDIGVPSLVTEPADDLISGYHLAIIRPKENTYGPYLFWALRSKPTAYQFHVEAKGVTRYGLAHHGIQSALIPHPPLSEQKAIVRFLDHADEQIQHYIAGKERLIALLEEQRQALVHQAVTQGLDPNVRLRPSGVEWLGDVPEHWEMRRLGQCTSVSGGATPSMEVNRFWGGSVPWVTPKDMKKDVISDSSMKVTDAAIHETSLQLVEPPVVLMVVRGMILARRVPIAYTTTPVTINQDMKALRTLRGTDAIFLAYSLNSVQEAFKPLIDEAGHGTRRLPTERWRELPITMPPPSEQRAIIEYLDNTKAEINAAIDRSRRQIDLMNEYRTRLIADVVTGQLDVREADKKFSEDNNLALSPWDDIQGLESISAEGGGQRHLREKEKTDGSGNS